MAQQLWKTVWWFPQNCKARATYGPAVPLLDIQAKALKPTQERHLPSHVYVSMAPENHDKVPEVSMERSVDQVHT